MGWADEESSWEGAEKSIGDGSDQGVFQRTIDNRHTGAAVRGIGGDAGGDGKVTVAERRWRLRGREEGGDEREGSGEEEGDGEGDGDGEMVIVASHFAIREDMLFVGYEGALFAVECTIWETAVCTYSLTVTRSRGYYYA